MKEIKENTIDRNFIKTIRLFSILIITQVFMKKGHMVVKCAPLGLLQLILVC